MAKNPVKMGQRVDEADIEQGIPPVVLQAQPNGFVRLTSPDQLRQFEEDIRNFYGIKFDASQAGMTACETCSGGCSDDCGFLA